MSKLRMGIKWLGLCGLAAALLGCSRKPFDDSQITSALPPDKPVPQVNALSAMAGVPVRVGDVNKILVVPPIVSRPDPFALLPAEASYEKQQLAENLGAINGYWPMFYTPPPETAPEPVFEPQPPRRLEGVLIGDSVTAILDNGGTVMEIHPGEILPGGWLVVSIDGEKAVLRRVGSTKLPQEVVVRLEVAPSGFSAAPAQDNGNKPPKKVD